MSTSGEYARVSTWVSKTLSVSIRRKPLGGVPRGSDRAGRSGEHASAPEQPVRLLATAARLPALDER